MLALVLAYMATASGATAPIQLFGAGASPDHPRHRARRPVPAARASASASASMTIAPHAALMAVPRSFLGVSTEYWSLPAWAPRLALLEHVLAMLRAPGQGPMVLRIGGDSADHSVWDPQALPVPAWAFSLAPRWLSQAGQLVAGLHLRVILDLNLLTDSPGEAAGWAHAATRALPPHSISAFEVGNEPDIYTRAAWLMTTDGRPLLGRRLPARLTAGDYARDFRADARALAPVAPGVALAGPALARPQVHGAWVGALIAGDRRSLGLVTVHRYPMSGCVRRRHSPAYATVARLLSPVMAERMAAALEPVVDAAHDAGLPIRVSELNSVDCGGRPGVSDTFATALWAPDALFALLHAGVDGVNIHIRANTINAPFAITPGGLDARPLLYGLLLFDRALGPDARTVAGTVRARPALNLRAYAVRTGTHTLHVVLLDKAPRSVRVALRLPAVAPATVQRLAAPSAASRSGVTLGGRWLGADGRWRGAAVASVVTPRRGTYTVRLRHASAALLTVPVAPGALGTPAAAVGAAGAAGAAPVSGGRRRRGARRAPGAVPSPGR